MRALVIIGIVSALVVAGIAGAGSTATTATAAQHSIVVNGEGSVSVKPNRALLSFGVTSEGRTASAALRANATEMTKVIAALKAQGIAAADIRTENVSLSPRYNQNGESIIGYSATNSVGVTLRNLDKTGAVIDAAVEAGANQVNGPNLVRSDSAGIYRAALRAAISNARGKAVAIARASNLRIRRITDVIESGAAPGPLPLTGRQAGADAAVTPIEPGTQTITATVSVTFAVA